MEFKSNMEASKFRYTRWHHNYGIHLSPYAQITGGTEATVA